MAADSKTAGAFIAMLVITGCGSNESTKRDVTKLAKFEVAHTAVKVVLRDPDSAEFRNDHLGSVRGREVVCGEVNSTNGFGGKTGFQRYISNGSNATVLEEQAAPGEFPQMWAISAC